MSGPLDIRFDRVRALWVARGWDRVSGSLSLSLPAVFVLALALVWVWKDGGYATTTWLPGALLVLGLLVAVVLATGMAFESRLVAVSVLLFGAFTAWNYLSILWAQERGIAWDGANRTFLYFCVFTALVRWSLPGRTTSVLLGGYALAVAVIIGIYVYRATDGTDPGSYFVLGRLALPIDYPNGDTALVLSVFWPLVLFASRRGVPVVIRGLLLAAGGFVLETAILCESRATLVTVPATAFVYLLIVPNRLRAVLVLVPVGVVVALAAPSLGGVFTALTGGGPDLPALVDARHALARSVVALFFAGAVIALVDGALRIPARAVRALGIATLAVTLAVAAGASAAALAKYGDPVVRLRQGWSHFKSGRYDDLRRTHLLSGLGSGRYDLWRVAGLEFARHPVAGIGSDNYAAAYLRERRTTQEPLYPHSLELRVLAQTGVVGGVLFGGFLFCAIVVWWRSRRRHNGPAERVGATAGAMIFVYWFVYGSVDWFWEIPALGTAAFVGLALAMRTSDVQRGGMQIQRARSRRLWLKGGTVAAAMVAATSLAAPWLAARDVQLAASEGLSNPKQAFGRLRLARSLNPLSDAPDVIAGVISDRIGDRQGQKAAFERALDRNPSNWYALFELGVISALQHQRSTALHYLEAARRQNPHEVVIQEVHARVLRGREIDTAAIDREFVERASILQKKGGSTRGGQNPSP